MHYEKEYTKYFPSVQRTEPVTETRYAVSNVGMWKRVQKSESKNLTNQITSL